MKSYAIRTKWCFDYKAFIFLYRHNMDQHVVLRVHICFIQEHMYAIGIVIVSWYLINNLQMGKPKPSIQKGLEFINYRMGRMKLFEIPKGNIRKWYMESNLIRHNRFVRSAILWKFQTLKSLDVLRNHSLKQLKQLE